MKRFAILLLVIAFVLPFTACSMLDDLMSKNALAGISKPNLTSDKVAEMSSTELYQDSQSPSFYTALAEDPALAAATLANVDAVLASGTATDAQIQEAALVGASVMLETTQAAPLIDNIVALLPSLAGGDSTTTNPMDSATALIEAIMPTNPDGTELSEAEFTDMINALVTANDYFVQLGDSLDPAAGYTDPTMNAGEIAQNALVAAIVSSIEPPAGTDLGTYLYDLMNPVAGAPAPVAPEVVIPDAAAGSALGNLLAAAGMGDIAGLLDPTTTPVK